MRWRKEPVGGKRAREGDCVACVRDELARWRRWQEHAGQRGGQEKGGGGGKRVSHENGARGATSRALKFSLCKHGSRHASHKTRQRYLARLRLATGKRRPCVYMYTARTCVSACETAARYTQARVRERAEALVAYSSVLEADEEFNARASVLIGVGRYAKFFILSLFGPLLF